MPLESGILAVWIITGRGEVVGTFGLAECTDSVSNDAPERIDGACSGLTKRCFEFGEGILDWVKVRTIGWQVEQFGTCGFDGGADTSTFMAAEIVHDDDVTGTEFRHQD